VNEGLYSQAAKLVEDNAGLIDDLAVFVMGEWDATVKLLGIEPQVFRISKEKIDAFLGSKHCKSDHRPDESDLHSRGINDGADGGGLKPGIGGRSAREASLRTRGFEPDHLRAMLAAFDTVCAQLRLPTHEGSRASKRVASIIFDLAVAGETNEKRLVAKVLAELRLEGGRASVISRRISPSAPPSSP
jgi:hypothetical protein